MMAATTGSDLTATSVVVAGAFSSSWAIMIAIISTWPNSSAPMPKSRSRYLPGSLVFQAWKPYCIATVISPYWPPRISCILRAKKTSGPRRLGLVLELLLVEEHRHLLLVGDVRRRTWGLPASEPQTGRPGRTTARPGGGALHELGPRPL